MSFKKKVLFFWAKKNQFSKDVVESKASLVITPTVGFHVLFYRKYVEF
jgi:hypothetical protein